jgi:hypothetical protein
VSGVFLQTDPIPGGSANAYDYAGQDPINRYDLAGTFSISHFIKKHWKAIALTTALVAVNFIPVAGEFADAAEAADLADESGDLAESCLNSFTGLTAVTMANGTEKPIDHVQVGDLVLATDPQTGVTEARPVDKVIVHTGKHTMVDITLADGATIAATDQHPFWDATAGTFVYAINLRVGDKLLSDNGHDITVEARRVYSENITAYNLEIDGIHTYYAGTTPILVHNSCDISNPSSFEGASRGEAEQELQSNGWYNAGSSRGEGGVRWRLPGNGSDQVRMMPGNSADPNLIKQGPYIRFSISGTKYGPFSLRAF